jgi:hypothetical protein
MLNKFLRKTVFLLLLLVILFSLIQVLVAPRIRDYNEFMAASIDKELRHKILPSPRLVFIGGSNLAFGIDSKKISDSLALPVANLGLHAGLGLNFILNEARENIKPNDVIVLSTEYFLPPQGSLKLQSQLIDVNQRAIKYAANGVADYIRLLNRNFQRCLSTVFYMGLHKLTAQRVTEKVYQRDAFSAEGDNIAHLFDDTKHPIDFNAAYKNEYTDGIQALNQFIDFAKSANAKVYYIYPNYPKSAFVLHHSSINWFASEINQKLNCQVLGTPADFVLDDSLYYDSFYHLNKTGRKMRTDSFISLLKRSNI